MKTRISTAAVTLSAALFVISLTQDGYYAGWRTGQSDGKGWELFLMGWMGLLVAEVSWLANPALLLAYYYWRMEKYGHAATASLASVLFAASFLTRKTINNLDTIETITNYGTGYWLWLASAIVMASGSLYLFHLSKKEASTAIDNSSDNQMPNQGNDADSSQ